MGTHTKMLVGVTALVVSLALVACGDTEQGTVSQTGPIATGPGTLEVACVPTAEVMIDGAAVGTTPKSVELDAGAHAITLRRDGFEPHETTIEVQPGETAQLTGTLIGTDPTDPAVLRALAEVDEIDLAEDGQAEMEEFAEPERHRGRPKDLLAHLVWPLKNVRKEGLGSFCIEVSFDYEGDGYLEFNRAERASIASRSSPTSK